MPARFMVILTMTLGVLVVAATVSFSGCAGNGAAPPRRPVEGVFQQPASDEKPVIEDEVKPDRQPDSPQQPTPGSDTTPDNPRAKEDDSPRSGDDRVVIGPSVLTHRYESSLTAQQPTLTRVTTGPAGETRVDLISPNRHTVWIAGEDTIAPSTIEHVPHETGFDLVFDFHNDTAEQKRLGQFVVGGIRFPKTIINRAIFNDGKPLKLSHSDGPYFGGGANYPGALYSPAAVVQSGNDTIGMSLQYDVREYRHGVFIRVESPGGIYEQGGRNWQVRFQLARGDQDAGGKLEPGESRRYTLSVRAHYGDREQWVRTMVPYRDFFKETYGPVRYERDPRPVRGTEFAQVALTSVQNPRGFLGGEHRPDLAGFGPSVETLEDFVRAGYERIMVWSPSGVNRVNRAGNYPFNFTTGWESHPRLRDSAVLLKEFGRGPSDFGLWWGNSSYVMPKEWDVPGRTKLDIRNPDHVRRAREELDAAIAVNATTIGLDAMSSLPAWDAYEWVLQLQDEYPDVRFIFETLSPDFIHTLTPTYLYGTRIPEYDPFAANSPMMLADFLNPGHETWAQISGQDVKINSGLPPTAATPANLLYQRARKAAQDGYIPVVFGPVPTTQDLDARESWKHTIPIDLRD